LVLVAMTIVSKMKRTVNGKRVGLTGEQKKALVLRGLHLLVDESRLLETDKSLLNVLIDNTLAPSIDGYILASRLGKGSFKSGGCCCF